jgi:ABC-type Fe3+/spermidine/putrescine transport system ATPase subunit
MRIRITDLTKRFGPLEAVSHVSLEIRDGELFTLLGPSGCGKSTLLRLIGGFHVPDTGEIYFNDRLVNPIPPYQRNIGMVFQNYALWPHMTVWQNVAYGLKLKRLPAQELQARVAEGLRKVNLTGLEDRYPGQLSGGQQQRVALARALVLNPELLLLDEPLSNLDAKIRVAVRSEIRKLQKELGITTIYVTHDQEEALSLSDRIAVLNQGKLLQVGTPRELYEEPATPFVADFIGVNNLIPGTVAGERDGLLRVQTALGELQALRRLGLKSGDRCLLSVRPENASLAPAGGDGGKENRIPGKIAFASYLGNTLRYDVEAAGGTLLKVDVRDPWRHERLEVGVSVTVLLPAEGTLPVPA